MTAPDHPLVAQLAANFAASLDASRGVSTRREVYDRLPCSAECGEYSGRNGCRGEDCPWRPVAPAWPDAVEQLRDTFSALLAAFDDAACQLGDGPVPPSLYDAEADTLIRRLYAIGFLTDPNVSENR